MKFSSSQLNRFDKDYLTNQVEIFANQPVSIMECALLKGDASDRKYYRVIYKLNASPARHLSTIIMQLAKIEPKPDFNVMQKFLKDQKIPVPDIFGFDVGGKTGTAKKSFYGKYSKKKLNTFISVFPMNEPKYVLLVLLDEPKPAPQMVYDYRGYKVTNIKRNEAGWNYVHVAGKIIEKIGPILAINNNEFYKNYVVKKTN